MWMDQRKGTLGNYCLLYTITNTESYLIGTDKFILFPTIFVFLIFAKQLV